MFVYAFLITIGALSSNSAVDYIMESRMAANTAKESKGEIASKPADSLITEWTGAGNLTGYNVSNDLQGCGHFPGLDSSYLGTGEFPRGSEEYYIYSAGFWFGALLENNKPSVSKAAYNCDMGAMSVPEMTNAGPLGDISGRGIYKSTMLIPEGYEGAGDFLFVQYGEEPKPYQIPWPFTDLSLNKHFATQDDSLEEGDIFSDEDTYTIGGDWIPEDQALTRWVLSTGPYDENGLGIRVEQRTYSWSKAYLADVIVINYKIMNMNDFALKAPCFSFFMDPDIGYGGAFPGDKGSWDDLTGFDKARDLGYAYDSDSYEEGWSNSPGYIGVVFLETPDGRGLTGFVSYENKADQLVDNPGTDSIKYSYMNLKVFNAMENPTEVRMLLNSGPYPDLKPDSECNYTVGIVAGETYSTMIETVDRIREDFNLGVTEDEIGSYAPLPLALEVVRGSEHEYAIRYTLPAQTDVSIGVYDASGRRLEVLRAARETAGTHFFTWDAGGVSSGVYFVRLETGAGSATAKLLVLD